MVNGIRITVALTDAYNTAEETTIKIAAEGEKALEIYGKLRGYVRRLEDEVRAQLAAPVESETALLDS